MGMLSLQVEGSLTLAGVFASAWFTLGLENQLIPKDVGSDSPGDSHI